MKPPHRSLQKIENFVGNAAWNEFVEWCGHKNLKAMPANAWTLAAYIRSLGGQESLTHLRKRVADIGKAHAEKSKRRPDRDPLIEKTFRIIEKQADKNAAQSKLFDDAGLPDASPPPTSLAETKIPPKPSKARVMRSTPKLVSKRRRPKS